MGEEGTWAEGALEYYFICRALFDKHGKKVKMLVYTYPCIPDKRYSNNRPCLRNIRGESRENFCTIAPDGLFQNALFDNDDPELITIDILNLKQGHFRALVPESA